MARLGRTHKSEGKVDDSTKLQYENRHKEIAKRAMPKLTQFEQQVMAHLMTAIELGGFDEIAPLDDLAKTFGRQPNRFKQVVNRLVQKGYVTIHGNVLESVYPTVAALIHQKPGLSEAAARKLLQKLGLKRK